MERPLPNLFVVGFPKCGTSALFHYLDQHPDICGSTEKETRYLYPLAWGGTIGDLGTWLRQWDRCGDARYRLEASPAYVLGGTRLLEGMLSTARPERIIVILRDPVRRMRSGYEFLRSRLVLDDAVTYDRFVARCVEAFEPGWIRTEEPTADHVLSESAYAHYLAPWVEAFGDRCYVTFAENLAADTNATLERLVRWLDLDTGPVASFDQGEQNVSLPPRAAALHRPALWAHDRLAPVLRDHPRVEAVLKGLYLSINAGPRRTDEQHDADALVRATVMPTLTDLPRIVGGATLDPVQPAWYAELTAGSPGDVTSEAPSERSGPLASRTSS